MRKAPILAVTLVICVVIAYVFFTSYEVDHDHDDDHDHDHSQVHLTREQMELHEIETTQASAGILKKLVSAPAKITIATDRIAHVYPKSAGIILQAGKNLGEQVFENETLLTIESKEVAEAKSAYLAALKKEQFKNRSFQREQSLFDRKVSATQDYYSAQNEWEEAMIDLELGAQKLCSLGLCQEEISTLAQAAPGELRIYTVRSPLSGSIIDRHVVPGELVSTEQELYIIADLSKVWAEINLFSQDRPYVKQGQIARIQSHEGQQARGKVIYLSPVINEDTRTSLAIAEIENPLETWLPGTFIQAELVTDAVPVALSVPKESIQLIDGQESVFVANEEGFEVRQVTIGRSDDHSYEILSGLLPGEEYASKNTFLLKAELKKDEAEHMD